MDLTIHERSFKNNLSPGGVLVLGVSDVRDLGFHQVPEPVEVSGDEAPELAAQRAVT
jgi:chemotaxis methyl-accepting protein methylase